VAFTANLRELSGALGDLGTLLPLMLGAIAVAGARAAAGARRVRRVLPRHRRAIPAAALGALLPTAAGELALTWRRFDCRPSRWPVIEATAAVTVWVDACWALVAGFASELVRLAVVRAPRRDAAV